MTGESGLGKSTLVNSMFLSEIYGSDYPGPSKRPTKTLSVEKTRLLLKERNVSLNLTIVDTPGFECSSSHCIRNCWSPVVDYIESQYEEYLNAETKVSLCLLMCDVHVTNHDLLTPVTSNSCIR